MYRKKLITIIAVLLAFILVTIFLFSIFRDDNGIKFSPHKTTNSAGPIVEPKALGRTEIVDNFVIFWPKYGDGFFNDNKYDVYANGYKSTEGEVFEPIKFSFTVTPQKEYEKLQLFVLEKYIDLEGYTDKFLSSLPQKKNYSYNITYRLRESSPENPTAYDVDIYVESLVIQGQNESLEEYKNSVRKSRNEAENWIKSKGVELEKANIYYYPSDEDLNKAPQPTFIVPFE